MAYPPGYYLEFVRSLSNGSLIENAAGSRIWMRTSDGLPLEQQYLVGGSWVASETVGFTEFPSAGDTAEPDYIGNVGSSRYWRARKPGEDWIPSTSGIQYGQVAWAGAVTFRVFTQPRGADVVIDTAAQTIDSEGRVNLAATVTPLSGTTIASRAWTATGGTFVDAAIEDAVWVAPFQRLGSGLVPYTLTLTVTDSNGNVTSAEVIMTVREVPVIEMAIGGSGKLEGIAVQGSGALAGMASGSTVVYRQRVGRSTEVIRSTSTGTRSTQASSRNTVYATRNTSLGSRSTSTGSRSTQASSRSTVYSSRNTSLAARSTDLSSRNTNYSSRNTSIGSRSTTPRRSTTPTRSTGGVRQTRFIPEGDAPQMRSTSWNRNTDAASRLTASGATRNTSTGSRSTDLSRSTTPSRQTTPSRSTNVSRNTSASSRNTSTGSRLTSRGRRQTNVSRSTEANSRDTSTGSRNTTFTRITEV